MHPSSFGRWHPDRLTPHTEALCAVVWHLLVNHPELARAPTKWESGEVNASPHGPRARRSYFIVGGASFLGSHFIDPAAGGPRRGDDFRQLLLGPRVASESHQWDDGCGSSAARQGPRGALKCDARAEVVIHLASNRDIARAYRAGGPGSSRPAYRERRERDPDCGRSAAAVGAASAPRRRLGRIVVVCRSGRTARAWARDNRGTGVFGSFAPRVGGVVLIARPAAAARLARRPGRGQGVRGGRQSRRASAHSLVGGAPRGTRPG